MSTLLTKPDTLPAMGDDERQEQIEQQISSITQSNNTTRDKVSIVAYDDESLILKWQGGMISGKWRSSYVTLYTGRNDYLGITIWDCAKGKNGRLTTESVHGFVPSLLQTPYIISEVYRENDT
jgi:hypothetical protein